jgi:ribonuclease Z
MKVVILGTAGMCPTKERNVSASLVWYDGEGILFDCGEGTQRQMLHADMNRNCVTKICISHWHADHVAGILPYIQTLADRTRTVILDVYGPKETKKRLDMLLQATYFDNSITIRVHEFDCPKKTIVCETPKYYIEAINCDHSVPTLAYNFVEKDRRRIQTKAIEKLGIQHGPLLAEFTQGKDVVINKKTIKAQDVTYVVHGKKISIILDTALTPALIDFATNATLLVCEATFDATNEEKASDYKHLTSTQAAQLASMANVEKLVLTHISQRYKTTTELLEHAKMVFENTSVAHDLLQITYK